MPEIDQAAIADAVRQILKALGEDPEREGLADTPERVARFYAEVFDGLNRDPADDIGACRVHQPGEFIEVLVDQLHVPGSLARCGDEQRALDGVADVYQATDVVQSSCRVASNIGRDRAG